VIHVARAQPEDIEPILALANWAAENTPANFAVAPEPLAEWTESFARTAEDYPWLVARDLDRDRDRDRDRDGSPVIAGFAKASPHRARGAYAWTAEVSVYVDPNRHRSGIGKALYRALLPTLRAQGYVTLLAGITPPNPSSERLHESFGFRRCGTYHRVGFKFGRWYDVGYWDLQLWPDVLPPEERRRVVEVWPNVETALGGGATLSAVAPSSAGAASLVLAANRELSAIYPEPGATHFRLDADEVAPGRGAFVTARLADEAVGCGAVRALGDGDVELKRMFVSPRWRGLGISALILARLEAEAAALGARRIVLETGSRQDAAIALYQRRGYAPIPPFGEYVASPLSVCFAKNVAVD
jgi:L-amino acid N-acyltransferase YncA